MAQVVSSDWRPDKPFGAVNISSMRQIVDLANFSASQIVNTTGQSGHVGAAHYADMIKRWARVEYVPVYCYQEESPTGRAGSVWKCGRAEDEFPRNATDIKATEYRGRQWQHRNGGTTMRNTSKVAEGWWDYTTLDTAILDDAARLTPRDLLQLYPQIHGHLP